MENGLLFERITDKSGREQLPCEMTLTVSARGRQELSAYLAETYPEVRVEDVLTEDNTISRIERTLQLVEALRGTRPNLDGLDFKDEAVFRLLCAEGNQDFGVFQQGCSFLREIQPDSLEELTAAAAFQARDDGRTPQTASTSATTWRRLNSPNFCIWIRPSCRRS